jgi:hypothetical protein
LRPDRTFATTIGEACRRGWRAAVANLRAIVALEGAMAAVVAIYYLWPAGHELMSRYGQWQSANGGLGNGISLALAGGLLSEVSFVYFQNRGRWQWANLESLLFKLVIFFISGVIVYYFYRQQAVWWGNGTGFSTIVPKVIVDQFGYTVIFSAPYFSLLTRWHALRYSGARLWQELRGNFLTDRFLPLIVTNWVFWIPAVSFVYAMPLILQPPLAALATAIWGLLVAALGSQEPGSPAEALAPAETQPIAAGSVE